MNIVSTIKKIWKSFAEHAWILHVCKRIRSSRYFGEMAEMDAQILQDKIRKFFAKHAWNSHVCKRLCSSRYFGQMAEVDAQDLQALCEYINPSYSRFIEQVKNAIETAGVAYSPSLFSPTIDSTEDSTEPKSLISPDMIYWFYHDREKFLKDLQYALFLGMHNGAGLIYNALNDFYARFCPTLDEVKKKIGENGLEGHVVLRGQTIRFKQIKVNGSVKLAFGGKFNRWLFNRVQFCDDVAISVYSLTKRIGGRMIFRENICCGKFSCSFTGIPRVYIGGNLFHSSLDVGVGSNIAQNGKVIGEWLQTMRDEYPESNVEFSNNYAKGEVVIDDKLKGTRMLDGHTIKPRKISEVNFLRGNHIGGLRVPLVSLLRWDKQPVGCNEHLLSSHAEIGNFHFGTHERIEISASEAEAFRYKHFFITLKHRAIEKRDREAEFGYGRQERYFERGITASRQDKFALRWSDFVSNSGVSWIRPAVILLIGQWILAAIFIGGFGGCGGWLIAAVESLNPLSSLDDIAKSPCCEKWIDSLSASIYNAVRRILSLALLYEIIKVLRRFYN